MSDQRPDNPFDTMRRVINHEANQDDDGGFFAKLGGIDPEPDDDGPTAKGLFQHMTDRFPYTSVNFVRDGTPIRAELNNITGPGWNIKKSSYPGFFNRGGLIRTCIVWKSYLQPEYIYGHPWRWQCRKCNWRGSQPTWKLAYQAATRHARNHHRSGK